MIVIIGAGVAGLSAARALREAGEQLRVVEARERTGGRILTSRDPATPLPIELGAEFVHGAAAEVVSLAREAKLLVADVRGERWRAEGSRLTRLPDFWDAIEPVMSRLAARRNPDRSFQEFLDTRPGGARLARARRLAREFVEGFQAADASLISERSLADGGMPADAEEQRIGRVLGGYDRLVEHLVEPLRDDISLGVAAERVEWRPGSVRVTLASGERLEGSAAIITVPLAVLLAAEGPGALRFDPVPERPLRAAASLAMGHARRVILAFAEPVWEKPRPRRLPQDATLAEMSFLHGSDERFPVWWTALPIRAPCMVGWAGGPRAAAMAGAGDDEIVHRALAALSRQLGISRARLERSLTRGWTYDWASDPYARGAYSYAKVGGADAGRVLGRPVASTLFFAGEAASHEGRNGTVDGAIASGRRAARQLLRARRRT